MPISKAALLGEIFRRYSFSIILCRICDNNGHIVRVCLNLKYINAQRGLNRHFVLGKNPKLKPVRVGTENYFFFRSMHIFDLLI